MLENEVKVPNVGAEVQVRITPSLRSNKTWIVRGKLLTVRHDPSDLICGSIEVIGELAAAENPHGWQSDATWIGCVVAAAHNKYDGTWHATQPVCDRAKVAWCKAWEAESELPN
jgi:hypothetical protein